MHVLATGVGIFVAVVLVRSEWIGSTLSPRPPSLSDNEVINVGSGAGDSESDTGLSSSGNG